MGTLRHLRTFVTVAREGTLAAAAERVALTQAAVSLHLRALEAELKRELFDRSGRRLALNAAGRELLPVAQRMLSLHDELRSAHAAGGPLSGRYRVGSIVSAVAPLSRALVALKQQHPLLDAHLVAAKSVELVAQLEAGELDAAIVVRGEARPAPSFAWTPLYSEPLVVVAHPGVKGHDALRTLREQPFLRFDPSQRSGALIDRALRRHRVRVQEFLELNSTEGLVELVRQGVGVSLLPRLQRATWERDPALRLMALPGEPLLRHVGLLQRRDRRAPLARAIAEHLAAKP
jgi:DNA-binding transcriptional LysR family regulator